MKVSNSHVGNFSRPWIIREEKCPQEVLLQACAQVGALATNQRPFSDAAAQERHASRVSAAALASQAIVYEPARAALQLRLEKARSARKTQQNTSP